MEKDLYLDCAVCKTTASMMATRVAKFSGVVRVIGGILLVPSFFGMLIAVLTFGSTISMNSATHNSAGADAAVAIGVVFSLVIGIGALVGGLLGWLLLLNRNVWKCRRCGSILDRA